MTNMDYSTTSSTTCQLAKNTEQYFNNNYLERCQVATPIALVQWAWKMAQSLRGTDFSEVLDLGCGDARFSCFGHFQNYVGVEVDRHHAVDPKVPTNARIDYNCALLQNYQGYDLCIGNPPYVRHHDMDTQWQRAVANHLSHVIDQPIDLRANAFLYFMLKAIVSTNSEGLIALIVPFEWVSRPSARWIRDYISKHNWSTHVYRLPEGIFPRVLTTASLTIIDKSSKSGTWSYHSVDDKYQISQMSNPSGTRNKVLQYSTRNAALYAQRGLSPGTQKVFCLTEEERIHNQLEIGKDVIPCLTSLKAVPASVKVLTESNFRRYYVDNGARCWLIQSAGESISTNLTRYLESIDESLIDTATCKARSVWYKYNCPLPPRLLFSTGFVYYGPQFVENRIFAVSVGAVAGIFGQKSIAFRSVAHRLRKFNFESSVVNHSGQLKKIEINQMNTVLNKIYRQLNVKST